MPTSRFLMVVLTATSRSYHLTLDIVPQHRNRKWHCQEPVNCSPTDTEIDTGRIEEIYHSSCCCETSGTLLDGVRFDNLQLEW